MEGSTPTVTVPPGAVPLVPPKNNHLPPTITVPEALYAVGEAAAIVNDCDGGVLLWVEVNCRFGGFDVKGEALTVRTTSTWTVAAEGLLILTSVLKTPKPRPAAAGLPTKVIIAGVLEPDGGLKESHEAGVVDVGVTAIAVDGELVIWTPCDTVPAPKVVFKNTTLGETVIVFCATRHVALPNSTAAMVRKRGE